MVSLDFTEGYTRYSGAKMFSKMIKVTPVLTVAVLAVIIGVIPATAFAQKTLSLAQAIEQAQTNDPWIHGNKLKRSALLAQSVAANTLPDPKVSLLMANVPTNTWNFDQEAMTQLKVGISQMFPRGDERAIKQAQLQIDSTKFPLLNQNRKAMIAVEVAQLWLDAYLAQKTITLIQKDQALFEQMADVAKASYASAFGKTRQQDVIRSQLELVQLADRLAAQYQGLDVAIAQLNEWLYTTNESNNSDDTASFNFDQQSVVLSVTDTLPIIRLSNAELFKSGHFSRNALAKILLKHPSVLALDVKQQVAQKNVALANEQYKPQWGVNASYAHRNDTEENTNRADLLSVGVTFDLPFFTEARQDKLMFSSIAQAEAIKTEKLLRVKQMLSGVAQEVKQIHRLAQRQMLYKEKLIKQTHEQAEASLTAYTNDDGSFSEVVRARIAELNARISALQIDVNALKSVVRANYFLVQAKHQPLTRLGVK